MPFRDRAWEDYQRDTTLFPAYTDYIFGTDTREMQEDPIIPLQIQRQNADRPLSNTAHFPLSGYNPSPAPALMPTGFDPNHSPISTQRPPHHSSSVFSQPNDMLRDRISARGSVPAGSAATLTDQAVEPRTPYSGQVGAQRQPQSFHTTINPQKAHQYSFMSRPSNNYGPATQQSLDEHRRIRDSPIPFFLTHGKTPDSAMHTPRQTRNDSLLSPNGTLSPYTPAPDPADAKYKILEPEDVNKPAYSCLNPEERRRVFLNLTAAWNAYKKAKPGRNEADAMENIMAISERIYNRIIARIANRLQPLPAFLDSASIRRRVDMYLPKIWRNVLLSQQLEPSDKPAQFKEVEVKEARMWLQVFINTLSPDQKAYLNFQMRCMKTLEQRGWNPLWHVDAMELQRRTSTPGSQATVTPGSRR